MIAENLQKLIDIKADIKNAINGKGGSVGERFEDYAPAIENLPSGGVSEEDLGTDTIFVDHTGKIVARFSPEEIMTWTDFSAVTVPEYEGLRFVKFTHTLEEIQNGTWNDVGLCYEPEDGNTHIFVENCKYATVIVSNTAASQIDWGDGNIEVLSSVYSNYKFSHTYADYGDYEIVLRSEINSVIVSGQSINTCKKIYLASTVEKFSTENSATAIAYNCKELVLPVNSATFQFMTKDTAYNTCFRFPAIPAIVLDTDLHSPNIPASSSGTNTDLRSVKFICAKKMRFLGIIGPASALRSVDMKYGQSGGSNNSYYKPYRIERIYFSEGTVFSTAQGMPDLSYNTSLKRICGNNIAFAYNYLPSQLFAIQHIDGQEAQLFDNLTELSATFFVSYNLSGTLKFSNLTKIGNWSFRYCYNINTIDFSEQTAVPTLASLQAFDGTRCKFLIPDALYDEWTTATNWGSIYRGAPDRFIRV